MSTHYSFLGIDRNASVADIKKAYRKLALKHHPDKNKSTESESIFKRLVEVYDVLSDPEKKAAYDRTLVALSRTSARYGNASPYGGAYSYNSFSSRPPTYKSAYQWQPPTRPPHTQRTSAYSAKTTSFSYDDDEFDFAYKNNQSSRDSFSASKTYFQSTNRPQPSQTNRNNMKYGSNFQKTGSSGADAGPGNGDAPRPPPPPSSNMGHPPYGFYNPYMRPSTNHRFRPSAPPYGQTEDENSYPRGPVPPHAHHPQPNPPPSASTYNYTQGTTSMPSVPSDPLPKSWKKQQTNFKSATTSTPPSANNSHSSPPPATVPVPPHANGSHPKRPKTPPSNNRPSFPTAASSASSGLKFDVSGVKNGSKSTPQNIRTQKKRINKKQRNGIPLNSSSTNSTSFLPSFVSPSGRPVRTEQEPDARYSEDDELVEIDEATFQKNEPPVEKRAKPINSDSPLDFKEFGTTTPLTQTNGDFNMSEMSSVLKESDDDVLNGKKTKKHKVGDYEVLNASKLGVIDGISDVPLPIVPTIEPQNFADYKLYKNEFERFQLQAFDLRKKLTEFLGRRIISDKACFLNVFRSDDNMSLYEQALTTDIEAQVKLFETNQAIIRVMSDYKKYKSTFE